MQPRFLGVLGYKDITKLVKVVSLLHLKDLHVDQLISLSLLGSFFKQVAEE